jgi:ATP-dependent Clp protease ATP-binding subunit ClpC
MWISSKRARGLKELDRILPPRRKGPGEAPEKPAPEKRGNQNTGAEGIRRDLTEIARKNEMDPVIGRKSEIER